MKLDETLLDDAIREGQAEIDRLTKFVAALTEARRLVAAPIATPVATPDAPIEVPSAAEEQRGSGGPPTMVEAIELIFQQGDGKPMHATEVYDAVKAMGFDPPKSSLVSTLSRDRRFRFKALGKNWYRLATAEEREAAKLAAPKRSSRRQQKSKKRRTPLKAATTKAASE